MRDERLSMKVGQMNERVGRLIMLKECLKHGIVPFIITDDLKGYYYRGLQDY